MLLALLLALPPSRSINDVMGAVQPSPLAINRPATYLLTLTRNQTLLGSPLSPPTLPAGAVIRLTFPPQFQNLLPPSPGCPPYSCSTQGLVVSVRNYFPVPSSAPQVSVSLTGLTNPASAVQVGGFRVEILSANGELLQTSSQSQILPVLFVPGSFNSIGYSFSNPSVRTRSNFTISVNVSSPVPKGATLLLAFANLAWSGSCGTSIEYISGSAFCADSAGATLVCAGTYQSLSFLLSVTLASSLPADSLLTVTVKDLLSPPTVNAPADRINVQVLDLDGYPLDSRAVTISGLSPGDLSASVAFSPSANQTVNQATSLQFGLRLPSFVCPSDTLLIAITRLTPLPTLAAAFSPSRSQTLTSTASSITLTNFVLGSGFISPGDVGLTVSGVSLPPSTAQFTAQLTFFRGGQRIAVSQTLSLAPIPGLLYSQQSWLQLDNYSRSASTTAFLTVKPMSPLPASSTLAVVLPPQITPSPNSQISLELLTSGVYSLLPSTSIRSLVATIGQQLPGGSTVRIKITRLATPNAALTTSRFSVSTAIADSVVDSLTALLTVTTLPGVLTARLSATPDLTSSSATLSISLTLADSLPSTNTLRVQFPTQVKLPTSAVCQAGGSSVRCAVDGSSVLLSDLPAQSSLSLTIAGITSPVSTEPTSAFVLTTTNGLSQVLDTATATLSVSSTCSDCLFAIVSSSSPVVSSLSTLTLSATSSLDLPAGSTLKVVFPPDMLSSRSDCSSNLASCSVLNSQATLVIPRAMRFLAQVSVSFVRLPATSLPVAATLQLATAGGGRVYSGSVSLEASYPFQSTQMSVGFSSRTNGVSTSLTITATANPSLALIDQLVLSLPGSTSATAPTVSGAGSAISSTCNVDHCVLRGTFPSSLTFTVTDYRNPWYSPSPFVLTGFKAGAIVFRNTVSQSQSYCAPTCLNCDSNNIFACSSCSPAHPFSRTTHYGDSCASPCLPGSFSLNGVCTLCAPGCRECDTASTSCTVCAETGRVLQSNSCLTSCHAGYYPALGINGQTTCFACLFPCSVCSSTSQCQGCKPPYQLVQLLKLCTLQCLSRQTFNSALKQCVDCPSQCLQCTPGVCTRCRPGSTLVNGGCSAETFPYPAENAGCLFPCVSCSGATCLTCLPTFLLYLSSCIDLCPPSTFIRSQACSPCGANCLLCFSSTQCILCEPQFFRTNTGTCTPSCAAPLIPNLEVCSSCSPNCRTCLQHPTFCNSCQSGLLLQTSTQSCVVTCSSSSQAADSTSTRCVNCASGCSKCSIKHLNCTECLPSFFLSLDSCANSCSSGFANSTSRRCEPCSTPALANCLSCSQTACLTCKQGLFLYQSSCDSTCPTNFVMQYLNNTCTPCSNYASCKTCNSSAYCFLCDDASSNPALFDGVCLPSCPLAFILQSGRCDPCTPPCQYCQTTPSTCTRCRQGLFLLDMGCVPTCPTPSAPSISGLACVPCQPQCKSCLERQDSCNSCAQPLFLYKTDCLGQCPTGIDQGNVCLICEENCVRCNKTSCLLCSGAVLFNGHCQSACPGSAPVLRQNECRSCSDPFCASCNSSDFCTRCHTPMLLLDGLCLSICPANYHAANSTCTPAPQGLLSLPPFPGLISAAIISVLVIVSKLRSRNTRTVQALSGMAPLAATIALACFAAAGPVPLSLYLLIAGLAAKYAANLAACIYFLPGWLSDAQVREFLSRTMNRRAAQIVFLFSLCSSFRCFTMLTSRLFDTRFFALRLQASSKALPYLTAGVVQSCLVGSLLLAASIINIASSKQYSSLLAGVDCLLLAVAQALFSIFSRRLENDYFESDKSVMGVTIEQVCDVPIAMAFGDEVLPRKSRYRQEEGEQQLNNTEEQFELQVPAHFFSIDYEDEVPARKKFCLYGDEPGRLKNKRPQLQKGPRTGRIAPLLPINNSNTSDDVITSRPAGRDELPSHHTIDRENQPLQGFELDLRPVVLPERPEPEVLRVDSRAVQHLRTCRVSLNRLEQAYSGESRRAKRRRRASKELE